MVVVKLTDESALLILYKTFLVEISAAQAKQHAPRRKEPTRLAWKDWRARAIPVIPIASPSHMEQWNFEHCHSYGSRVVVNGHEEVAVAFDLNPWAARNARRFPKPALRNGEDKDAKALFSTNDITLPHCAILRKWYYGMGFAQSPPGLATDPMGFTEVVSADLSGSRSTGLKAER